MHKSLFRTIQSHWKSIAIVLSFVGMISFFYSTSGSLADNQLKNEAVQRWYEQLPQEHWLKRNKDDIYNTSNYTIYLMEILQLGVGTFISGMELQAALLQEHESKVINFMGKTMEVIEGREAGKYALINVHSGEEIRKINVEVANTVIVAFYYEDIELMLDFSEEDFYNEFEPGLNGEGISLANRIVYSYVDDPDIVSFYNGIVIGLKKGKTTLHLFCNGRHFTYDIKVSG